jgi:hypothetical protein
MRKLILCSLAFDGASQRRLSFAKWWSAHVSGSFLNMLLHNVRVNLAPYEMVSHLRLDSALNG